MPTPTYRMLRCHIHKSSAKNTAAMATRPSTRGVGVNVDARRRTAIASTGNNIAVASAMRQNADAVGPISTHRTNTAEVLISTAPNSIVASGPRAAALLMRGGAYARNFSVSSRYSTSAKPASRHSCHAGSDWIASAKACALSSIGTP